KTRLTPTIHTSPTIGKTNREYSPSGAQIPPLIHVVPPRTPRTTAPTPIRKAEFEIRPARQSPNVPAIISIARGNELKTTRVQAKSLSPDVSAIFPEPATEKESAATIARNRRYIPAKVALEAVAAAP